MDEPPLDLDTIAPECERQWAARTRGDLDYRITVPKWAFLQYLVARHGILLHGSGTSGIDRLEPVSRSWGGSRITGQPGLFAVDHALMAMYFGIIDRTQDVPYMSNGLKIRTRPDGQRERRVHLGVEFVGLAARPFRDATVYILPRETFSKMGEFTSLVPVEPLARLNVSPDDFPLLERLWGSDVGPLASQFGAMFPFLRDVGTWPTKRSQFSSSSSVHASASE